MDKRRIIEVLKFVGQIVLCAIVLELIRVFMWICAEAGATM